MDSTETMVQLTITPTLGSLSRDLGSAPLGYAYGIELYDSYGRKITESFRNEVKLTIPVDPFFLEGMGVDFSDIGMSYYDPIKDTWVEPEIMLVDPVSMTMQVYVDHFSLWAPTTKPSVEVPLPTPLESATKAESSGEGWYEHPWFGPFFSSSADNWIYHPLHQWLLIEDRGDNGLWIYDAKLQDWLWANSSTYEMDSSHFFYSYSKMDWLWHSPSTNDPRWFYDYSEQGWFTDEKEFSISVSSNDPKMGFVLGNGMFKKGELVQVRAEPAFGYSFIGWTGSMDFTETNQNFVVDGIENLQAQFAEIPNPRLTVATNGSGAGIATGGGIYQYGELVSLVAQPDEYSEFGGWYENNQLVSSDPGISIVLNDPRSLEARFERIPPAELTVELTGDGNGLVSGVGTYEKGEFAILEAVPSNGSIFSGWILNGVESGNDLRLVLPMETDQLVLAKFEVAPVILSVAFSGDGEGQVDGQGSYGKDEIAMLVATPINDSMFVGWYEDGNEIGSNPQISLPMESSRQVEAKFVKITVENILNSIFSIFR